MQLEDDQQQLQQAQPSILVSPARDREGPLYAILHSQPLITPTRRQSIVTLHPIEGNNNNNNNNNNSSQANNKGKTEAGPSR